MISKWHKIDLHIHTDKSNLTKKKDYEGNFDIGILTSQLKKNGIKLISFTDHNIINCEAYNEIYNKDEIDALVGVELDIAVSEENLEQYVTSLSKKDNTKIEIKPYHVLVIFKSKDYMKINELLDEMYSKISNEIFNSTIDLNKNKLLRTTTFKYLIDTFHNNDFFIIAHGNKDKGIVPPHLKTGTLEDAQYNILMGEISALEMKSNIKKTNTIEKYNEGFKKFLNDGFEHSTTSYVVFSDNHDCNNYNMDGLSTWLKGHLDYETLRLGFSDPESRIHTSDKAPSYSPHYIENISIGHNEKENTKLELSPYLNVIIGGRSSGKSLLFNTLMAINNDVPQEEKIIFEKNYKKYINIQNTKAQQNIGVPDNNISIKCETYCQEKIIDLFKDETDLKRSLSDFFIDFKDEEILEQESKIERYFADISTSYREFHDQQNNIKKGDRAGVIINSSKSSTKIFNILEKELCVDYNIKHHTDIIEKIEDTKNYLTAIQGSEFKGDYLFNSEEKKQIEATKGLLNEKITLLLESKLKTKVKIDFYEKVKLINKDYIDNELGQELQTIESSKRLLDSDIDDYHNYFLAKLTLRKSCKEIENIEIKIEDKENETLKYIFKTKLNFEITKDKIIDDFFMESFLGYNKLQNTYENILSIANPSKDQIRIKQKTGLDGKKPDNFDTKVKDFILKNKSNKQYEIIEKGSSPISTSHTSQGRKASIFLDIKLSSFLEDSKIMLLMIDQIEDNIDNKYISENLVSALRKLKNKVQIILVTHNPSIAIYGDAENIIVCQNENGHIEYKQGGLENEEIRNDACKILDGGDVAFRNRMDKYKIDKITNNYGV